MSTSAKTDKQALFFTENMFVIGLRQNHKYENVDYLRGTKLWIFSFGNEVWFRLSPLSLCYGAPCCVNQGGVTKMIFGHGTRLTVEPSEYCNCV